MWTTEYTAETKHSPRAVWNALRDIHTGAVENSGGDTFVIHGPYAVGTELSVTPKGQDTFKSEIIELVEDERYADRTQYGDLILTFAHTITSIEGGTRVTHELTIDGPTSDEVGPELGPQISEDFPQVMEGLFDLAALSGA